GRLGADRLFRLIGRYMANTFSRWVPKTFKLFDTEAKLTLRAFNKKEAPAFKAAVMARFNGVEKNEGESETAHETRVAGLLEGWKGLAKDSFAKYVRLVEPLVDAEEPDHEIKTGAELYDEAPGDFVMEVMLALSGL